MSRSGIGKIDLKKELRTLYSAPVGDFVVLDIPALSYFMADGHGDPNVERSYRAAVEALYAASYTLKFMSKDSLGRDYVVPPLEGLWWAKDPADFVSRRKDRWSWTMMVMVPDFIPQAMAGAAIAKARGKRDLPALSTLRFAVLKEGQAVQTLHIGSYDDEGPILRRLHHEFLPANRLAESGNHHEIYLGDPRKVTSARLRTILRQPVKPIRSSTIR